MPECTFTYDEPGFSYDSIGIDYDQCNLPFVEPGGKVYGGGRKTHTHRYDPTFESSNRRPRLPHEQVLPHAATDKNRYNPKQLREAAEKARIERDKAELLAAEKAAHDALIFNDNEAFMMLMVG